MVRTARFLNDCLGLIKPDRRYYDALSDAGLPSMSSIYSNIQAPSTADLGGSLGTTAQNQAGDVNNAFKTYSNYASSLPTSGQTYDSLMQKNGIPQLQKTTGSLIGDVNNLQQTIDRVPINVSANTGNSLVTDSQRQGMIVAQQLPLQQQLTPEMNSLATIQAQLGNSEANVTNEVNAQNANQSNLLGVAGAGLSSAESNAALVQAGFSQDEQNTLAGLLKKMEIQGTLDGAEWATLSTLAENKQLSEQKIAQQQVANQYQNTPAGGTLTNTATGVSHTF